MIRSKAHTAPFDTTFTVFPNDTNYNTPPCIFGGKMLAEMDNAAAMAARRILHGGECTDCVTVRCAVDFARPAYIGDIVHLSALVTNLGHKSITVTVTADREDKNTGQMTRMGNATFVFCSRRDGVPYPHGQKFNGTNTEV